MSYANYLRGIFNKINTILHMSTAINIKLSRPNQRFIPYSNRSFVSWGVHFFWGGFLCRSSNRSFDFRVGRFLSRGVPARHFPILSNFILILPGASSRSVEGLNGS